MKQRFQVNYLNSTGVQLYCNFDTVDEAIVFYSSIELEHSGQWKNMFVLGESSFEDKLLIADRRV